MLIRNFFFHFLAFMLVAFILVIVSPRLAAPHPPACTQIDENLLPQGGLNKSDPKVLFNIRTFTVKPAGKLVKFSTYSRWDKNPENKPDYCLRYEIENIEKDSSILRLFWELAEISTPELKPGKRKSRALPPKDSIATPTDAPSEIQAFFRARAYPRVFQIVEDIQIGKLKTGIKFKSPELRPIPVNLKAAYPAIHGQFTSQRLSANALFSYVVPKSKQIYRKLGSSFTTDGLTVAVWSEADFADRSFSIRIEVQTSKSSESYKIFAPHMFAMNERISGKGFLSAISKFATMDIVADKLMTAKVSSQPSKEWGSGLFLVKQPITLVTEESIDCFLVDVYIPYPISVGLDYCKRWW